MFSRWWSPRCLACLSSLHRLSRYGDQDSGDDGAGVENHCQVPIPNNKSVKYQTQEDKASIWGKPAVEQESGTNISCQEKVLKRPDKALSCPRCNSFDTKFCYFNNYNVNQPRHYCRNCQRYWTAGGTIRNVPVGAGRRKNKLSQYHGNKIGGIQVNILNSAIQNKILSASSRPGNEIGEVQFNNESLYESIVVVHDTDGQKGVQIGNMGHSDNVEKPSPSSLAMASTAFKENDSSGKEMEQDIPGHSTFAPLPLQDRPGPMWAYPWNPDWNMTQFGCDGNNLNPSPWGYSPMLVAGFCTAPIAIPFGPASFLASKPGREAGKYNMALFGLATCQCASSSTNNGACKGNCSPNLGKHYREPSSQSEGQVEKLLWAPKTLRIDDPNETAKSSLWATLGIIKPDDKSKPIVKSGIFKAFQRETVSCSTTSDVDPVMQANPAALSRSQSFQEST